MGDLIGAADALEEGRRLDLADKWINSKASKYLLRAGRIAEGDEVVSLFTKHEGDSRGYLKDMQTVWFEQEAGAALAKAGPAAWALALKFLAQVEKHFDDFLEDLLEFHGYCLRKTTLRAYIGMLRSTRGAKGRAAFAKAVHTAVGLLLRMHDDPAATASAVAAAKALTKARTKAGAVGGAGAGATAGEDGEAAVVDMSKMTAAAKKRALQKLRKAKLAALSEKAAKGKAEGGDGEQDAEDKKKKKPVRDLPVDLDPDGAEELAKLAEEPLAKAHALLEQLREQLQRQAAAASGAGAPQSPAQRLQTQLDVFDVEVRRGKYLQAFRALHAACQVGGKSEVAVVSGEVLWRLAPFLEAVEAGEMKHAPWQSPRGSSAMAMPAEAKDIILELGAALTQGKSARALAEAALAAAAAPDSTATLRERLAACRGVRLLSGASAAKLDALVLPGAKASPEDLRVVHRFIAAPGADLADGERTRLLASLQARASEEYPRAPALDVVTVYPVVTEST